MFTYIYIYISARQACLHPTVHHPHRTHMRIQIHMCIYTWCTHIFIYICLHIYIYTYKSARQARVHPTYVITISQRTHVATRKCRAKGKFSKPILLLDLLCQMTIALTFENFLHRWACRAKDAQKKYRRVYMHTNEYIYT